MEKRNYRDMLAHLKENDIPNLMSKVYVAGYLGVGYRTLQKIINKGLLKETNGKITIGALANYLCDWKEGMRNEKV